MSYRHLPLCCACGQTPDRIVEVGFSDEHELVIHWWCSECERVRSVSKPLTECWQDCPAPDAAPARAFDPVAEDARFLESIGIRYLE